MKLAPSTSAALVGLSGLLLFLVPDFPKTPHPVLLAPEASVTPEKTPAFSTPKTGDGGSSFKSDAGSIDPSLSDALQKARYAIEPIPPDSPHNRNAEFFAANPRQQLRLWFATGGVEFASGLKTSAGQLPWFVHIGLASVGRDQHRSAAGPRSVRAKGNRVEIQDPATGTVEWYENTRAGLEQGFTVQNPPDGTGPLRLELGFSQNSRPVSGENSVEIRDSAGNPLLACSELKAWDATGRLLPSRFGGSDNTLTLEVDDAAAIYPVTIDPLFTNIEARLAEEKVVGDEFATAVALESNTAVIGAPGADGVAGPNSGVAYVFVRNGAAWEFQARLQSEDAALDHQLGTSVSVSADTAVLGSPGREAAYVFVRANNRWTQQARLQASDPAVTTSFFGASVQISGDSAVVGAFGIHAAYIFQRTGSTWSQQTKLTNPASAALENFGFSVALSGDTAVVGSPAATVGSFENQGCVDVFVRNNSAWTHQQRITGSSGAASDQFGSAVALHQTTLLIGIDSVFQSAPVAAYFFTQSGNVWSEQTRISPAGIPAGSRFGAAVSLDATHAAIGAPGEFSGATYIFSRSGNIWTQQSRITPQNGFSGDLFGASLAIQSGTVLIGSPKAATGAGPESGLAEVRVFQTNNWTLQTRLTAGDSPSFDLSGTSVALSADTALVGVPFEDTAGSPDAGAAYVFVRSGNRWIREAKLSGADISNAALFGTAVALDQNAALVGAPHATLSSLPSAGAAYVFRRSDSVWTREAKLSLPSPAAQDQFGAAVAIQNQTALIGAPFQDNSGAVNAGAAAVFLFSDSSWSLQAILADANPVSSANAGAAVALDADSALLGAPGPINGSGTLGKALVFSRTGPSWALQTTLSSGEASAEEDGFGSTVALLNNIALIGAPFRNTLSGTASGAAYVFQKSGVLWSRQTRLTSADASAGDRFGTSVALAPSMALIGAPNRTVATHAGAGVAYLFTASASGWSQQAQLSSALDSSPDDRFGSTVALQSDTALVGAPQDDTADLDSGSAYVFKLGELPAILTQPESRTVLPGTPVIFSITASGTGPLRYQWRRNGIEILGAQTPSLTVPVPAAAPYDTVEGSYDVLISNQGGVATSAPALLKVNALSVLTQVDPTTLDPDSHANGFLVVRIFPPNLDGTGWRFVGEQSWRAPAIPVSGLAPGDREIEFRPIPGYLHPLREPVSILGNSLTAVVDREYFPTEEPATGQLTVNLLPAAVNPGARWRFQGEPESAALPSGATRTGLSAGIYLVEFSTVDGLSKPRPLTVSIAEAESKTANAVYTVPDAVVGNRPQTAGLDAILAPGNANPLRFVGQIRNEAGSGTGFVVKPRVVCTAAHVVWDEVAHAPFKDVRWYFQIERGSREPAPLIPRGSYILSAYSAARQQPGTIPGQSTPESQNFDVAVLWFFDTVAGRGGSSGYLASDAPTNEWLLSDRLKTIVGYPLDGIDPANQGRIHAIPPINAVFSKGSDQVYLTSDMTSSGGNSGGPVCVQHDNGKYYPAAIYLGGSSQTRVRAIDRDVVKLFEDGEAQANQTPNHVDFGQSLPNGNLATPNSGNLTVVLEPADARAAGAAWRIGSNAFLASGQTRSFLPRGSYNLQFKPVPGYQTPIARAVTVNGATTLSANYVLTPIKPVVTAPVPLQAAQNLPVQFQIQGSNSPTAYQATLPNSAPLSSIGLAINPATGLISGSPTTPGSFVVTLTASNDAGTSDPQTLTLSVSPPGQLFASLLTPNSARGRIEPVIPPEGRAFALGSAVKLTAIPAPGSLFAGWSGSTSAGPVASTNPVLTLTASALMQVEARFVPNPFLQLGGSYVGLGSSPADPAPSLEPAAGISLTLAETGAFSGKLLIGSRSLGFLGKFNPDGIASVSVSQGRLLPPLTLALAYDPSGSVTGTLRNANTLLFTLALRRVPWSTKLNPARLAGTYTVLLPAAAGNASTFPVGSGYAIVKIDTAGKATCSGKLGDGTTLSATAFLDAEEKIPFFFAPTALAGGAVSGVWTFPTLTQTEAELTWTAGARPRAAFYPAAFSGTLNAIGNRFSPTPVTAPAFTPSDLVAEFLTPSPLTLQDPGPVTLGASNKLVFATPQINLLQASLNPKTGGFSGSFRLDGKTVSFAGVYLQELRAASALFFLPTQKASASLTLTPAPDTE